MLGVERNDLVRKAAGGRRVVVRAEDAVQSIDAEPRDRDHHHGDSTIHPRLTRRPIEMLFTR